MGRWLRKLRNWMFWDDGRQGATAAWSPIQSTTRAGNSDTFDELEMHRAFDRIAEEFAREPDWLVVFKSKTEYMTFHLKAQESQEVWNRRYEQLEVPTAYTMSHAKTLKTILAAV